MPSASLSEVGGVSIASDMPELSWRSTAPDAGTGTVHDVVRGAIEELPVGAGASGICLASGLSAAEMNDPSGSPPAGGGYWYIVRGRNSCGAGTWGLRSDGVPRAPGAPCP